MESDCPFIFQIGILYPDDLTPEKTIQRIERYSRFHPYNPAKVHTPEEFLKILRMNKETTN